MISQFSFSKADDNKENGSESINRSAPPSTIQIGTNKDLAMVKKIQTSTNRSYQENSQTLISTRSTTNQQTSGNSLLMGKIVGSNKDVTEETLFVGSEIPKYGVLTNHEMELEKVFYHQNLWSTLFCLGTFFKFVVIIALIFHWSLWFSKFQVIGNVNSWGVDVFRVAELVSDDRALTCITYKIFQVYFSLILKSFPL